MQDIQNTPADVTISIDRVVTLRGSRSLIYHTVEGIDPEQFSAIIERLGDGEVREDASLLGHQRDADDDYEHGIGDVERLGHQ